MTFFGVDNQTVELKITNYQYPEINDGDWDGNWLNIYLNVKSKVGHWQTVDPSLTTWEVQSLIDWLNTLSSNSRPKYIDMGFTEPNLSFELLNDYNADKKIFRIKFDLESRPQSATDDKEYFVDVIADNSELKKLSADLKSELDKYPERKPAHNSSHFMRVLATISILLLTTICFGQKNGHYSDFSSAFQNIDSVKSISINCMHNNEYGTDGCDSLPKNISKLHNLTSLYISESSIKSLPNSINELKQLKELSLNYLYYFNYETELCKLQGLDSLEYLGLWMARIKTLPTCIGQIKSLRTIDLSQNENLNTEKAFETLKQLPNLETLNLSGIDNLRVIPMDIDEVTNLKSIRLDYLGDKFDYKTSFDRLSSLKIKSLSLTNNWLNSLPPTISKLKELEYIDLSDNNFEFIPTELFELTMLKHIKIQHNNNSFKNVGNEITKLRNLETINFGNNWKLNGKQVIISMSKLPNLKELDFFGCRLDTIPNEIMNFPALEKLNLTRNSSIDFADLFKKLSSVKTLKHIDISDNKLTTLPKEIGLLTSLEYLVIGQNSISTLPEEFFNLTNLKVLNVYGNYDSKISEAELQKIKDRLPNCKIINEWVFRD